MKFTTVVAVDAKCIEQLEVSCPTWRMNKPDLWMNPLLVIFDRDEVDPTRMGWLEHPDVQFAAWPPPQDTFDTQREKMLSSFVHLPGDLVKTAWWRKVDTDAIATAPGEWIDESWFDGDDVFIGSRWGYTKPANQMAMLDLWAGNIPGLNDHPPLDLEFDLDARCLRHRRLASWISFYRTDWTREVARYADFPNIPVPSQDGYHFYVAERRNDPYTLTSMKKRGWTNISRLSGLKKLAKEILCADTCTP